MSNSKIFQDEANEPDKSGSSDVKEGAVYLGIDIGSSKVAICTSEGSRSAEPAMVAYSGNDFPNDSSGEDVFYGTAALEQGGSGIKEPIRELLSGRNNRIAVRHLLEHCIVNTGMSLPLENTRAVVTVTSNADTSYKRTILGIARELFRDAMVADDLFCVAYGSGKTEASIFVDIGTSCTNICCISGDVPDNFNFLRISSGIDDIERELVDLVSEEHEDLFVQGKLAREWIVSHSYVGKHEGQIKVEVPLDGSLREIDITEELGLASEYLVSDIISGLTKILSAIDPEIREMFRNNIYVCGGGSKIRNIDCFMEDELKELGGGKVFLVDDPIFAGAIGARMLAEKMPHEFWEQLKG
ncbi:rod shape-determining protein [Methanolobus sp. ZRKC3]|uniref:rod shape-determining protein n=1 Tax=Methanolobus sp. ZRKC3 TaxID=3125786 RepID=UPI00324DD73A